MNDVVQFVAGLVLGLLLGGLQIRVERRWRQDDQAAHRAERERLQYLVAARDPWEAKALAQAEEVPAVPDDIRGSWFLDDEQEAKIAFRRDGGGES